MNTIKKSRQIETKYIKNNEIQEVMVSFEDMVGNRPKLAKNYSFKLTIFGDSEEDIECFEEQIFQSISSIQQDLYQDYMQDDDEDDEDDDGESNLI